MSTRWSIPLADFSLEPLYAALKGKTVVLHGADYDLRLLRRAGGFVADSIFDTMLAARLIGRREFSYAALVKAEFGIELTKGSQKANWARRPLTPTMAAYAQNDTRYLLEIADRLEGTLHQFGRWEWFEQSCARALATAAVERERDTEDAWRINGSGVLRGRAAATLRELWHWREEEARVVDRPTFHVLRNEDLLNAAKGFAAGEKPRFDHLRGGRKTRFYEAADRALALDRGRLAGVHQAVPATLDRRGGKTRRRPQAPARPRGRGTGPGPVDHRARGDARSHRRASGLAGRNAHALAARAARIGGNGGGVKSPALKENSPQPAPPRWGLPSRTTDHPEPVFHETPHPPPDRSFRRLHVLPAAGLLAQSPTPAPTTPAAATPSVSAPAGTSTAATEEHEGSRMKAISKLTPEERQKLKAAHQAALQDPAVKAAEAQKGQRQGRQARLPRGGAQRDAQGGPQRPAHPRKDARGTPPPEGLLKPGAAPGRQPEKISRDGSLEPSLSFSGQPSRLPYKRMPLMR